MRSVAFARGFVPRAVVVDALHALLLVARDVLLAMIRRDVLLDHLDLLALLLLRHLDFPPRLLNLCALRRNFALTLIQLPYALPQRASEAVKL